MRTLFWISVAAIGYVYAGYPLILAVWAKLARRRPRRPAIDAIESWPAVSVIIAARNEAGRLPARIHNLLDTVYPGAREVIVVSNGSTDGTAAAARTFGADVAVVELPAGGKPQALNAGVARARGDILVFADARQQFGPHALMELVANFSDPAVGGVTGELIIDAERESTASTVGDGVGLYWKYEKWLRRHESDVWSTLGATGAIYALRRELWRPLPPDALLDDVLAPMRAVLEGWRVVFEERAQAFDRAATDAGAESRRKIRTLAGNYQILAQEPRLLLPFVNPVWLQYVSHKVGRLLVPWALASVLVASVVLAFDSWWFTAALAAQAAFYGLALFGAWLEHDAGHRAAAVDMSSVRGQGAVR